MKLGEGVCHCLGRRVPTRVDLFEPPCPAKRTNKDLPRCVETKDGIRKSRTWSPGLATRTLVTSGSHHGTQTANSHPRWNGLSRGSLAPWRTRLPSAQVCCSAPYRKRHRRTCRERADAHAHAHRAANAFAARWLRACARCSPHTRPGSAAALRAQGVYLIDLLKGFNFGEPFPRDCPVFC